VLVTQQLHKLNAIVNAIGLEVLEVEATSGVCRIDFAGKVDEFDKGAANLSEKKSQTAGAKTKH
jgi:hypothetical protein